MVALFLLIAISNNLLTRHRLIHFLTELRKSPVDISMVRVAILVTGLLAACLLVYWPGVSGPFIFDDFNNIVRNNFLRKDIQDLAGLIQAIFSTESGPTGRPVAMFTFALNSILAHGTANAFPFKLTNILIHWVNSVLVFVFSYQLAQAVQAENHALSDISATPPDNRKHLLFALTVSLFWAVSPIQLTSVLYVVQRMTSLSATFVLASLTSYLYGRQLMNRGRISLSWLVVVPLTCGLLGLFTKENAVLLALFLPLIEFTIFPARPVLRWWPLFYKKHRSFVLAGFGLLLVAAIMIAVEYVSPGYRSRTFSLAERLMTEARIVVFYVSLILLPRTNEFGVYHDDIALSRSLAEPWSTLPAIALILASIAFALVYKKRWPLASFGILFFFTGHLLESTLIPLELAHEHRNYLPSMGIILALSQVLFSLPQRRMQRFAIGTLTVLILVSASITFVRANQWSNIRTLITYEAIHHPKSARAQIELSGMLGHFGKHEAAIEAARAAADLAPEEPGYLIELQILASIKGQPDPAMDDRIVELLSLQPATAFMQTQLQTGLQCIKTGSCSSLYPSFKRWLTVLTQRVHSGKNASLYSYILGSAYYFRGETQSAISLLELSAKQDPVYAQPLFLLAVIYIENGDIQQAERIHARISKLNRTSKLKWTAEFAAFTRDLELLKSNNRVAPAGK